MDVLSVTVAQQSPVEQCCHVRLEWEQLLEQHHTLQDSFDQLQAEAKFDADHATQQMQDREQEISQLRAQIAVSELGNFNHVFPTEAVI